MCWKQANKAVPLCTFLFCFCLVFCLKKITSTISNSPCFYLLALLNQNYFVRILPGHRDTEIKKWIKGISDICSVQDKGCYCWQQYLLWCCTSSFCCFKIYFYFASNSTSLTKLITSCKVSNKQSPIANCFVQSNYAHYCFIWILLTIIEKNDME